MQVDQSILIVDDRPENLLALERVLAELGVGLVRATSGEEALAATLRREFAMALLDVRMPGMDGYELAELLRGDPKTRHMPIIFLAAISADEEQVFKGYESGAVDYLVRPYSPTILVSKVRVFLELHALRVELRHQREQLAAVNRELESFAYSASHDLRAPLRAIEGFSQILLEDCIEKLSGLERDYLLRVSSEATRMSEVIDGLLELSRVTRAELDPKPVDLTRLSEQIVQRLREADPDRRVETILGRELQARGDPRLLTQALENLLSNAWKFSTGEDLARIEVGRKTLDGAEASFVSDNGGGFDMKHAGKLFAPFQRLHGMKEFPGHGIGLSTVQRIVARHGGRVWCESELGAGTTFYFTLAEGGT